MALVPDELRNMAERFPDRLALVVDGDGSMTFAEWERRSNAGARGLVELGVTPGDRVALLIGNQDALLYQIAYLAIQKAGGVVAPINPRLARREIAHVLANAGPRVLVAAGDQLVRAMDLAAGLDLPPLVIGPEPRAPQSWASLEANEDDTFQVSRAPSDLADILYTSGTTGLPKGVASTHDNVLNIPVSPSEREDALLHAAPLATALGTYGAMIASLRLGLTNICLPSFDTSRFADLIGTRRPGWLMMVPAQVLLLRESGVLEGIDTSSVWMVLFSTAPMPPEALKWLAAKFPNAMLVNAYGLTEAGASACVLPPGDALRRPGSVGKPIEGAAIRVVDEHGNDLAANQPGELLIRIAGGNRFYFGEPESTARMWQGGWVHTGDLGYLDADGFVYVVDRKKDMIIRGGYNIYSIEVENALYEHPAILEVAVLGVPHAILGQDVLAVVRLAEGQSLDLETLRTFLADRLADYKHPRRLVAVDHPLPRTSLDKVDKLALRAELELDSQEAGGSGS
ncbi:MAG: class I adenylate-forming enzyme family protein [Acidimicrobiales bacterium]